MEVDSLSCRITNIRKVYCITNHIGLRERLIYENKIIYQRLNEISSIAKVLKNRTSERINFSNLLAEKCERTIAEKRFEKNLFFL